MTWLAKGLHCRAPLWAHIDRWDDPVFVTVTDAAMDQFLSERRAAEEKAAARGR